MRGVSTVLDVTLFLLLVSAAVVALAVPPAAPPRSTADETAESLAATTTNVTYDVETASHAQASTSTQTATGTHADLLGRGAVASIQLSGEPLVPTATSFRQTLRERTESVLSWSPEQTSAVAVWEPYPDAPLRGRFAVGGQPPPGVDVSTATLIVPASVPSVWDAANESATDGFERVADAVVSGVLTTTLRPDSLGEGRQTGGSQTARLRAYTEALDVDARDPTVGEQNTAIRAAVERQLTRTLASDMRDRYATPQAAAGDLRTGTVRIVVREWEP